LAIVYARIRGLKKHRCFRLRPAAVSIAGQIILSLK